MTTAEALKAEFEKRGPWVTKFVIGGQAYGGQFDAMSDTRIMQFFQAFPNVQTILEMGSMEGGHSFALAQPSTITRVVAIEGRPANVERAKYVQSLFKAEKVEFVQANLETIDLTTLGRFDAVYCVGVLYHLPEPWKLVEQIVRVTSSLFVWTHYVAQNKADKVVNGLRGWIYQEHGLTDPLSGMSASSFWPTLDDLRQMLTRAGFERIRIVEDNPMHPHGPCVALAASTQ